MSGVVFRGVTAQISTGTSLKTILQLVAAAQHRVRNVYFSISFEGVTPTDAPIQVRILKQTTAGTMSSLTLVKDCPADDETLQTTAQHTATVEPTAGDVRYSQFVHPQGSARRIGPFTMQGGEKLGIDVLAANAVDCIVSVEGEE
jgi:hypothetical protein